MRLNKLFLATFLLCGFSLSTLAHEAPVVDAQQEQQQEAITTQAETSTGGSWQPVSSSANSNASDSWQPVAAQQPVSNKTTESTPVQEASQAPAESGSADRRIRRLEQQISNYNQMNLPQQVTDLQQKNAELQGQLEVAQHNLKTLTDQQKLYYQDLQQQIAQLEKQKAQAKATKTAKSAKPDSDADENHVSPSGFVKKENNDADDAGNKTKSAQSSDTAQKAQADQPAAAAPSLGDADTYDKAFRSLSDKHFDAAQNEFHAYLKDYPKGHFAVNAHFWLGEIALMHEKYDVAIKQFQTVVAQYPTSSKVSDAKLKIAMIHAATGKMNLARTEFAQIRKSYPGTTAAQLASIRLQQLANATSVDTQ